MKIYNEIISRFNNKTNKWETISEDSFDYSTQCLRVPSDRFPAQREAVSGPNQS